jgi:NAD(P)-dependent dehydrogenase (short-subunit alcohol dehydrogenase family)
VADPLSILVTGASSGFGRLTAETLARRGHQVFASMRDPHTRNVQAKAELEQLARKDGVRLEVLELDVRDDHSVDRAVDAALASAGRIDVLVNNAGEGRRGVLESFSVEEARDLFETNVFSVLRMNRAVVPHMRRRRSGLLVHISSGLARTVRPMTGLYAATKFAVEAIAETYRYELAAVGVDSVLVEPGAYATRFFDEDKAGRAGRPAEPALLGDYRELLGHRQGLNSRLATAGDPQEVADAITGLIELLPGARPLRTTVGSATRADPLNEAAAALQREFLAGAGMLELTTLATETP